MSPVLSFLLNSPWVGVTMFMLAAILSALACYAVVRRIMRRHIEADEELCSRSIIARLGALHALILALMFAQEMDDYRFIIQMVSLETNAIGDVYNTLSVYGEDDPASTSAISNRIADLVANMVELQNASLSEARPNYSLLADFRRIERELGDLQPTNDKQVDLRTQMLADWDALSGFREQLRAAVGYQLPRFFWIVVIAGFFAVVIPCYAYSPNVGNLVSLSTFAAFNGIVMYVMFAITDPLSGPGAIEANSLQDLLTVIDSTVR